MRAHDLDFAFPTQLIATEPARPTRVAFIERSGMPREMNMNGLLAEFKSGDLLVINETKVLPARIFAADESEILFLRARDSQHWEVLFAARDFTVGDTLDLPYGLKVTLVEKGLPQIVKTSRPLDSEYFTKAGEMALPPYIQQARGQRHNRAEDARWYQTDWAAKPGSVAAPTASLHFLASDLEVLRARGVQIARVTLHVGAGTFMPVRGDNLSEHVMHEEWVEIPAETLARIRQCKIRDGKIWALGTTVARALESHALGLLKNDADGASRGGTQLFIYPPFQFQIVDRLMTNFHQPKSTLLALVAAFAGLERVQSAYAWAIEKRFRLFSYGDLSVWS